MKRLHMRASGLGFGVVFVFRASGLGFGVVFVFRASGLGFGVVFVFRASGLGFGVVFVFRASGLGYVLRFGYFLPNRVEAITGSITIKTNEKRILALALFSAATGSLEVVLSLVVAISCSLKKAEFEVHQDFDTRTACLTGIQVCHERRNGRYYLLRLLLLRRAVMIKIMIMIIIVFQFLRASRIGLQIYAV